MFGDDCFISVMLMIHVWCMDAWVEMAGGTAVWGLGQMPRDSPRVNT